MRSIKSLVLGAVAAVMFTACVQNTEPPRANATNASTANSNTTANTATTTAAAPSTAALMTLENAAWDAWKNCRYYWRE